MGGISKKLWQCSECDERFTSRNQWHSCGQFVLDDLFIGKDPSTRILFDEFARLVEQCGPVKVIPQKTRIAFQTRMRFAAIFPRKHYLRGHLVLSRRREEQFFNRIQSYSRRNHVHEFRLDEVKQLDKTFCDCLREAYSVGEQKHWQNDA